MKVLIIGSGGREHALGWKLKKSPQIKKLYFAPGNGGTASLGKNIDITVDQTKKLISFSQKEKIDLIVVGPEAPLEKGLVDAAIKASLKAFGATKKAARLETDKAWACRFMKRHHIPMPQFRIFKNPKLALKFVKSKPWPQLVVKASGLAAGKGVLLPNSLTEAQTAIKRIMVKREFGSAGNKIVIQERLFGPEVSYLAFSDGKSIAPMTPSQDHKRAFDNDQGPNTGGMGVYAPVPFMTPRLHRLIRQTILQPTINGMRQEGYPYKGILYAGLIITAEGPKVLEYNARFGDPETQPLMLLLKSDLAPILLACIKGTLKSKKVIFHRQSAVCVVIASKGYPGSYKTGKKIKGLKKVISSDVVIFHAGTAIKDNQVVTSGGRVLGVTARGKTFKQARQKAYSFIGKQAVHFTAMHYRKDIGKQAMK